ncbi:MAG: diguanylate cyclase [Polyangiaceae bacterium]
MCRFPLRSMHLESLPPADRPARILVVDDDRARRELFAKVLTHEGYSVDTLAEGTGVIAHVRDHPPDLVLLDVMLPEISGFEICGDLRMMDETRLTPIILITSAFQDEQSVVRGLLSGADDYVVTPFRLDELRARVRVQLRNRRDRETLQWVKAERASLKSAAMTDALTGLSNRRAADAVLDRALEGGEPILAVLVDIDHFKQINDTHGHAAGDGIITEVAGALNVCARTGDVAARYGGDEFLVIVRGAALAVADRIGERYLAAIRKILLAPRQGFSNGQHASESASATLSVSIGIAGTTGDTRVERGVLLSEADEALYEAKRLGRNRVVVRAHPVTGAPIP